MAAVPTTPSARPVPPPSPAVPAPPAQSVPAAQAAPPGHAVRPAPPAPAAATGLLPGAGERTAAQRGAPPLPGLPGAGEQILRARARWGPVWVLPTRHGWGTLLVAGLLGAAWCLVRLDLLASVSLLLAAPVVVSLAVAWCLALVCALPRPWLTLYLPAAPQAGEQALVRAQVAWRLPRFLPSWVLWKVGGAGGRGVLTPLDQGVTALGLEALGRGPAAVEAARLRLREPLGLVSASVPVGARACVLVLPRPVLPERALDPPRACRPGGGQVGTAGEEHLASLRDYRPGDPLASIHWKQSARADHLLVTEQEPESHLHARLALVAGPDVPGRPDEVEAAVSLVAGIMADWSTRQHLGVELSVLTRACDLAAEPSAGSPAGSSAGTPAGLASPGSAGSPGWRLVRWSAEAGEAHRLLRVLALLDLRRPGGRALCPVPAAWQEPEADTWAPRLLAADVVVCAGTGRASGPGGAGGAAGSGAPGGTVPLALDPASRGTLLVVAGGAGAQAGRQAGTWAPAWSGGPGDVPGDSAGGGPGDVPGDVPGDGAGEGYGPEGRGRGAVPPTWQVLTVEAASGGDGPERRSS